ncbi:hypothetical protein [Streptomyces sp. NPDC001450]
MGWLHQDDDGSHEGWVVAVLSDGANGVRDTFGDEEFWEDRAWAWSVKYDGAHGYPRAAAVRAICHCGWSSGRQRPTWDAPEEVEERLRRQWHHHTEVAMSRTLPPRIQQLMNDLEEAVTGMMMPPRNEEELDDTRPLVAVYAATLLRGMADTWQDEAVRAAKADYSWEEIARPLGVSKQAAHERFR